MKPFFSVLILSTIAVSTSLAGPKTDQSALEDMMPDPALLTTKNKEIVAPFGDRKGTCYIETEISTNEVVPAEEKSEGIIHFSSSKTISSSTFNTYNDERAETRFSPCSTFKIPNTLIALEEGILKSIDETVKWDKEKHILDPDMSEELRGKWARDMNLKNAFATSCVWFYQEIAKQVPPSLMKRYLKEFKYGNLDNSGPINHFWISSSLKISAKEQVEFLKKLYHRDFDLKESTYDQAEQVFKTEETPNYTLYSKTGSGINPDKTATGWYVGYVVRKDSDKNTDKVNEKKKGAEKSKKTTKTVYYFAINMDGKDFNDIVENRTTLARKVLKEQGIID